MFCDFLILVRCGPLIDLCRGPHVRHTGKIKAMKIYKVCGKTHSFNVCCFSLLNQHAAFMNYLEKGNPMLTCINMLIFHSCLFCLCHQNSSTYWEGRSDMETLQRIYGISFPDSKMLKEWERFQEEAKNRDHRKIGKVSHAVESRVQGHPAGWGGELET